MVLKTSRFNLKYRDQEPIIYLIDLFAGAGGTSTAANYSSNRIRVIYCINHDPTAIRSHAENHKDCIHSTEDIRYANLSDIAAIVAQLRKENPNCKIAIWASLECFVEGTLILTDKGLVDIKDIQKGDMVWTHKNRFKKVTRTMKKENTPTVIIKGQGNHGIETTSEHPFYIRNERQIWDNENRRYKKELDLAEWKTVNQISLNSTKYNPTKQDRSRWATPILNTQMEIPSIGNREMPLNDPEFWWLIGRYLGDGSLSKGSNTDYQSLEICCGKHEIEFLREKLSYWKPQKNKAISNELNFCERSLRTAHLFIANHKELVQWLLTHFGHKAKGKTLPAWIYSLSTELKQSLLDGYISADGSLNKKGEIEMQSVSKKLMIAFRLLAVSLGYETTTSFQSKDKISNVIEGRIVNVLDAYKLKISKPKVRIHSVRDEDHCWTYVKGVNQTGNNKTVYNISVEDDESYIADGIVVHNCTHFSKAKGGQSRDADSRSLAQHMFRYDSVIKPDFFWFENVREFMTWGPLQIKPGLNSTELYSELTWNEQKEDYVYVPIKKRSCEYYNKWVDEFKRRGYHYDFRLLNSADYGGYTIRTRFFGQFSKDPDLISWPAKTHSKDPKKEKNGLKQWKAVKDVLDLEDHGQSIFDRKKPFAKATYERIYAGLVKFVSNGDESFLQKYYSGRPEGKVVSMDGPAGTIKTVDGHALVFTSRYNGGTVQDKVKSIDEPIGTVTTQNRHAIATCEFITAYYGTHTFVNLENPCGALTTKDRFTKYNVQFIDNQYGNGSSRNIAIPIGSLTANPKQNLISLENTQYLMNPQFKSKGSSIEKPCFTIIARTDKYPPHIVSIETGLNLNSYIVIYEHDLEIVKKIKIFMAEFGISDIKQRMLKIIEMKRIQGFPEDYILHGTQADQKRAIGNSVEVAVGKALFRSITFNFRLWNNQNAT